jgi:hypothetical protein
MLLSGLLQFLVALAVSDLVGISTGRVVMVAMLLPILQQLGSLRAVARRVYLVPGFAEAILTPQFLAWLLLRAVAVLAVLEGIKLQT